MGLLMAGEAARFTPLSGGVSSDIWKVEVGARALCVKRALGKLKVAQDWRAPLERSRYEYAWMTVARAIVPDAAPEALGYDEAAGLIALAWYDPAQYRLWKTELRDGRVDHDIAAEVGRRLAAIHAGTAGRPDIAAAFSTDAIFHAIRLEPYLAATARVHTDLAAPLNALIERTASTRLVLVHGDVSPKNILVGSSGPLLLDAECAWYGDPAFDAAFCLNHLLLKCVWRRASTADFITSFRRLAGSYLAGVTWEPRAAIEPRIASLLAGLFLARVDGKSPVEYIVTESDKDLVRHTARRFVATPPATLDEIAAAWLRALDS
ncbi:MAG: phosphotransferase [Hyphomicrobiales bacterium]|nr:phosphotransferase [Hyphomicrobiales bacterium]